MANAPKPGKKSAKRKGFRVTLYGQVNELHMRDVGPSDTGLVRQTTGRSLNSYLSDMDIDSVGVINWLARRKAGEKKLTLAKVFETFPSYDEFNELMEDDPENNNFERLEDDDEDEVQDVIDGESVEVETHPLPPAAP